MSMTKIRGQQIDLDSTQGIDVESNGKLFIKLLSGAGLSFDGSGEIAVDIDGVSVGIPGSNNLSVVGFQNTTSDAGVAGQGQVWFRTDGLMQFKCSNNTGGNNVGVFVQSLDHINTLSGDQIVNTTAETTFTISSTNVGYTFKGGFFTANQTTTKVRATFILNTLTAVTLRLRAYYGSTVIADTGVFSTAVNLSGAVVIWEFNISARSIGGSGSVVTTGQVNLGNGTSQFGTSHRSGSIGINTTSDQAMTLTGQFGTASASDTVAFETWDISKLW